MLDTKDNTILEALKVAVVEAFFEQKTYYDSSGMPVNYGGIASDLVRKILDSDIGKQIVGNLKKEVESHPDRIIKEALDTMESKVNHYAEHIVTDGLKDRIRYSTRECMEKKVKEIILEDKGFENKVKEYVKSDKYKVNIQVNVTVNEAD